jgi:cell division septal protein FtsQ
MTSVAPDPLATVPMTTGSEILQTKVADTTPIPSDVDSIMRKMAEQQTMITNLNEQLQTKSDDVQKLSQKQRDEMMHVYQTVIKQWVDQQETVNPETRTEFKNGIIRIAEDAAEDNGKIPMTLSNTNTHDPV